MSTSAPAWLDAALGYVPTWLDYQMREWEQPGCAIAVAVGGRIVFERAFGVANLATGEPLTPRHRFRVASHSKTFTATGILKLRAAGKLSLDDPVGRYVEGLHDSVAAVTLAQLLSHSGGLVRDGADSGHFLDRKPFLTAAELCAELAVPQPISAAETLKYSNHGYSLLGLVIAAVTGEDYVTWIEREVVGASGLVETNADVTTLPYVRPPLAGGHTMKAPFGRRHVIPADMATNAMAAATGFVSTAADLARFFATLSPAAPSSVLPAGLRRDMTRRHWRDRHSMLERYYGLGTMVSAPGPFSHFGHMGSFPGTLTRTFVIPEHDITVSCLTNAVDGPAVVWGDGLLHILKTFATYGAADATSRDWSGRYWTLWLATDLVPVGGGRVLTAFPRSPNMPFADASVIRVTGADRGTIIEAQAYGALGEGVQLERSADGQIDAVRLGAARFVREAELSAEVRGRYQPGVA